MLQVQKPGPDNFDFWLHTWDVHNKRRKVRSLYDDPERNREAEWEEFSAVCGMGRKYCDGRVMVDHYEGTFPSGQIVKGVNVRAYNPETGEWSLVWLDNRQPPDFEPLVGKFEHGVGQFEQIIHTQDGRPVHVRFILDNFTEESLRWQQAFSLDGGQTWDINWIMTSTRRY
jgi:hypothetical protein